MKIGIITYHRANNVGAVLQNFALQKVLEKYDAETIDYRCSCIEKNNRLFVKRGLKDWVKVVLSIKPYITREKRFKTFRDAELKLSAVTYKRINIREAAEKYDVIITGSDQVWNLNLNGLDYTFFLDFVPDSCMRIAYAASMGHNIFPEKSEDYCVSLLKRFNAITVRENELACYLTTNGVKAKTVLDPTLLLTKNQWIQALKIEKPNMEKYVFVYMVANTPELLVEAKKYAKENGLQIFVMHYGYLPIKGVNNIRDAGPKEFISFIMNAEKIYCSSFHAVCFSLLFHKDFVCALEKEKKNNNSRLVSLCETLGITSRILENDVPEQIDYYKIDEELEKLRNSSLSLLHRSMGLE